MNECEESCDFDINCSDLNELACASSLTCDWIENIELGDCSDITNSSECYQTNQCSWYNAGPYGYWYDNCYGGTYEIDNSYCEEVTLQLGDTNNDGNVDVLDVVIIVSLVLVGEYEESGDLNGDGILNVLDIVQLVGIILN